MPITCIENVVSNAERRAVAAGETPAARITDVYAALPSINRQVRAGVRGRAARPPTRWGRELIRAAVGAVFGGWFDGVATHQVVEWFEMGGTLQESDTTSSEAFLADVAEIHGLLELAAQAGAAAGDPPPRIASAIDFVLEGLCAQTQDQPQRRRRLRSEPEAGRPGKGVRAGSRHPTAAAPGRQEEVLQLTRADALPLYALHGRRSRGDRPRRIGVEALAAAPLQRLRQPPRPVLRPAGRGRRPEPAVPARRDSRRAAQRRPAPRRRARSPAGGIRPTPIRRTAGRRSRS